MARIFLFGIVFYLLYRLIFDLIMPVYKTTRKVRQQFNQMHDPMQQEANPFQKNHSGPNGQQTKKSSAGEYIDFEEVKS
ncbi:MAG: hypothetical protein ACHQET_03060 [Chitinophagales bacterium]